MIISVCVMSKTRRGLFFRFPSDIHYWYMCLFSIDVLIRDLFGVVPVVKSDVKGFSVNLSSSKSIRTGLTKTLRRRTKREIERLSCVRLSDRTNKVIPKVRVETNRPL